MHLFILAHRRTASLPSGPLLDVGVLCIPSTPVFPKPAVFPSVSQFTRVLDETLNMVETEELALPGCNNSPSYIRLKFILKLVSLKVLCIDYCTYILDLIKVY